MLAMNYFLLPLKKYAEFKGRSRRKEYWQFFLFTIVVDIVLQILAGVLAMAGMTMLSVIIMVLVSFGLILPSVAVGVRRMHDVDKSGWYLLIPLYNLILACTDGTPGSNRYGPDPKRPEFEEFLSEKVDPVQPA